MPAVGTELEARLMEFGKVGDLLRMGISRLEEEEASGLRTICPLEEEEVGAKDSFRERKFDELPEKDWKEGNKFFWELRDHLRPISSRSPWRTSRNFDSIWTCLVSWYLSKILEIFFRKG
jgi:hypothetical protein